MRPAQLRRRAVALAGLRPARTRGDAAAGTAPPLYARLWPKGQASGTAERTLVGIAAIVASTMTFPISDVTSKYLSRSLPPLEVAWLRYLVLCILLLPLFFRGGAVLRTAQPKLQLFRAGAYALSTTIAILSFSIMPVAESTAIGFVSPLFVTALAMIFLKEKVGIRRWAATCIGFLGVMIIVRPGSSTFQLISLLPLAGAMVSASSAIATRKMKGEHPNTTLAYTAFPGLALLALPTMSVWVTPSASQIWAIAIMGSFAAVASLLQIVAYRNGPASVLASFSYTQLIFAAIMGYIVFGDVPKIGMFVGAAVIAGSGLYTAYRERVRRVAG